ncbi:amidohydrolase [Tenacibaculum sp. M341]|uniref:amidohydrolase n=1 Tax=Tenacibaculum sp. M341 TaxID=2530339 RepID=UPI001042ACDD|nr:amidohydrolase [Tenacibaculum sp. M341]TCI85873.1 amidohydrolase [Tenacibaculum sp. M341]
MNTLKTAFIQSNLVWENPIENRNYFTDKINSISNDVDLIILPEMFSTGFSMNANELAESMDGETVVWMQKMAQQKQTAIIGSIIIKDSSTNNPIFYNRLLFVLPSGEIEFYDKRHTFTLAKEHETFASGTQKLIIEYKGWKICPLICYDLRFPVWARNVENYDLLIYIASWPQKRVNAWDALLKARAIENMSYTIGVNRIGKDGNDFEYVGHSIALDCLGTNLSKENNEEECIVYTELHKTYQEEVRNKLGFLNDKDVFSIS